MTISALSRGGALRPYTSWDQEEGGRWFRTAQQQPFCEDPVGMLSQAVVAQLTGSLKAALIANKMMLKSERHKVYSVLSATLNYKEGRCWFWGRLGKLGVWLQVSIKFMVLILY